MEGAGREESTLGIWILLLWNVTVFARGCFLPCFLDACREEGDGVGKGFLANLPPLDGASVRTRAASRSGEGIGSAAAAPDRLYTTKSKQCQRLRNSTEKGTFLRKGTRQRIGCQSRVATAALVSLASAILL